MPLKTEVKDKVVVPEIPIELALLFLIGVLALVERRRS